jgi:hypothetical protein
MQRAEQKHSDETNDTDANEDYQMRLSRRGVLVLVYAHPLGNADTDADTDTSISLSEWSCSFQALDTAHTCCSTV